MKYKIQSVNCHLKNKNFKMITMKNVNYVVQWNQIMLNKYFQNNQEVKIMNVGTWKNESLYVLYNL